MEHMCVEVQSLIPVLLNGKLEPREHVYVAEHLRECPECREEVRFTAQLKSECQTHFSSAPNELNVYETVWKNIQASVHAPVATDLWANAKPSMLAHPLATPLAVTGDVLKFVRMTCMDSILDVMRSVKLGLQPNL